MTSPSAVASNGRVIFDGRAYSGGKTRLMMTYGAECWTLTKSDEKRIESAALWINRRMLRVSWTEHRTDESILTELNTTRQLLGIVVRRQLSVFGHAIRDGGCKLVKCAIQGK